ncbi:MAG TPA: hypothetical protein VLF18_07715 [Tahibacter sp.]|uniref:hypothetical protein n=1 Tax=Tahibacter sp. TaxID=2056211 RepID=UPI002CE78EE1|nr:hypothetical protein [Tahibacter sp.]HSX60067.1 hypothetical protein [Tahibacter sp.]
MPSRATQARASRRRRVLTADAHARDVGARLFRLVHSRLADDALAVEDAAAKSLPVCTLLPLPIDIRVDFGRIGHMLAHIANTRANCSSASRGRRAALLPFIVPMAASLNFRRSARARKAW